MFSGVCHTRTCAHTYKNALNGTIVLILLKNCRRPEFMCQNIDLKEKRNIANETIVMADIFVRNLISYISFFWLKVRNLVAYENHARIYTSACDTTVAVRKFVARTKVGERQSTKFLRVQKFLRLQ